ncbi:hypothetical protein ACJJTC_007017, partial [Scirpophaga incertulas]
MRARVAARGKAARHAPSSAALSSASRIDKYLSFRSRLPRLLVLVILRNLLGKLQEEAAVDQQNVRTAAAEFYKTSREYLEQWCQFNKELEVFEWANLTNVPSGR